MAIETGAHFHQNFRRPLDVKNFLPAMHVGNDKRGHVFPLGGERDFSQLLHVLPHRLVVLPLCVEPEQQSSLCGVSDDTRVLAGEVECGRGVYGHRLIDEVFSGDEHFPHLHLVLRERAGLVGADDRGGPHGFARVHLAYKIIRPQHLAHGVGQSERDGHRQTLRHGNDDQRDCDHDGVQGIRHEMRHIHLGQQPVMKSDDEPHKNGEESHDDGHALQIPHLGELPDDEPEEQGRDWREDPHLPSPFEIDEQLEHDDGPREAVADVGDELSESVELLVERCLHLLLHLVFPFELECQFLTGGQLLGLLRVFLLLLVDVDAHDGLHDFSVLRAVSHGEHLRQSVSLHDLRPSIDTVRRISGLRVGELLVHSLLVDWLPRQRGLVHAEVDRLKQGGVGRNFLAGLQDENVSDDDVAFGNFHSITVSDHRHFLPVVHAVEQCELMLSLQFEIECQSCGQEYGDEDADRFKKHGKGLMQSPVFVGRYTHSQHTHHKQDDDERV